MSLAREVSSDGRKMTSATPIAIEDHSSDGRLPIATGSSSVSSLNSHVRLIGMVAGDST
jgi:hypothetical protein